MRFSQIILLAAGLTGSAAFTSHPASTAFRQRTRSAPSITSRQLVPSGNEQELLSQIPALHDLLQHSFTLISDASAATADLAPAAVDESGWWYEYLQLFKSGLTTIHDVVDGPLRSAGITQTWGPSIALFTFGVRSLLLPLSVQQTKSAEMMKALKPYQDEIAVKFKDRDQLKNRATAKLFEDAGQNPLAGCLFSLAQLPIFLGLYRAVRLLAKDDLLNEPFLWIPNLEGPVSPPDYRGVEWLTEGWTNIDGLLTPGLGWDTTLRFLVMPVILVLTQSFTMSILTPPPPEDQSKEEKEAAEKSAVALKFLPLMIGYFSLQVPAGLTIYWITSNVFTLSQSLLVKGYYKANPPKIELPDYWDALDDVANMSPEERRAAAEAGIQAGPTMEQLTDEAKFHYVVQRNPLRESSASWERVTAMQSASISPDMAMWVESKDEVVLTHEKADTPTDAAITDSAKAPFFME